MEAEKGPGSKVGEKPFLTPEALTDGGSEYASATGTPTKEEYLTPLNSDSSTETVQNVERPPQGDDDGARNYYPSRQPVAPAAQPYVPPDLPKLLLNDPVEPSEVKLPLDDDDCIPPAIQSARDRGERTPLLPSPSPKPQTRQVVQLTSNTDNTCCCALS